LGRVIDDIEELMGYLEIEEWFVMGHSFGNFTKRHSRIYVRH